MTNWYSLFYWLTVADSVKHFFDVTSNLFTTVSVFAFIAYVASRIGAAIQVSANHVTNEEEKTDADVRAWGYLKQYSGGVFWPSLALALFTWIGYVATPSKKDCFIIIAGGAVGNFLQSDSTAKQLPHDVSNFLHTYLQKEMKDLNVDFSKELGINTSARQKKIQTLKAQFKNLTADQILEKLEADTTLIK